MNSSNGVEDLLTKEELLKISEIFLILEKWQWEFNQKTISFDSAQAHALQAPSPNKGDRNEDI